MNIDIDNLRKLPSNTKAISICATDDGKTESNLQFSKFYKLEDGYKITGNTPHWRHAYHMPKPLLTNSELSAVLKRDAKEIESHGYIPLVEIFAEPRAYDYQKISGHKTTARKPATRKPATRRPARK